MILRALALCAAPGLAVAQISAPSVPEGLMWPQALRAAVAACWNAGALPPAALAARVTLSVRFDAAARPIGDSIALLAVEGASAADGRLVYEAARRALIRCGGDGYPLPAAERARWQTLELTFDAGGTP